jgi:tRNA A22 N-methylase
MENSKLRLIKIEYDLTIEELDLLLYRRLTDEQKTWTAKLSIDLPNESIVDENEIVYDIILVDFDTYDAIDNMLSGLGLSYRMVDISQTYLDDPKKLSEVLVSSIDLYVKNNMLKKIDQTREKLAKKSQWLAVKADPSTSVEESALIDTIIASIDDVAEAEV